MIWDSFPVNCLTGFMILVLTYLNSMLTDMYGNFFFFYFSTYINLHNIQSQKKTQGSIQERKNNNTFNVLHFFITYIHEEINKSHETTVQSK